MRLNSSPLVLVLCLLGATEVVVRTPSPHLTVRFRRPTCDRTPLPSRSPTRQCKHSLRRRFSVERRVAR